MSNPAYLIQLEQKVQSLISDKKYKDAYNICISVLEKYPKNNTFEKLKRKTKEAVKNENEKVIKIKLKEINQLWKENKYTNILLILKDLLKLSPENRKLKKEYEKAQKAYLTQLKQQEESFLKRQKERLDEVLKTSPGILLEELISLEMNNKGNQIVKKLVAEFKEKLIKKKINEKSSLLESNKFKDISNFISELKKIDKKSPSIIAEEEKIEQRKKENVLSQKSEFVYGGAKHLDTLMKLKKFDKAMQASKEILVIDKENKLALRTLKTARRKLYKQSKNISVKDIQEKLPSLKNEFKTDKSSFIRI